MYRIWGPAWYRDRSNEELRLRDAIEAAVLGAPGPGGDNGVDAVGPVVTVDGLDLDAPPDWVTPYVPYVPTHVLAGDVTDPRRREELRSLVLGIITAEQPITESLLLKRVCETWGERRSPRVRVVVDNVIEVLVESERIVSRPDPGVLLAGGRVDVVRGPTAAGDVRSVDDVPDVEVRAAVVSLVSDGVAIPVSELTVRVARLFGWRRAGARIDTCIQRAVSEAARRGDLVVDTSGVIRRR